MKIHSMIDLIAHLALAASLSYTAYAVLDMCIRNQILEEMYT